VHRIGQTDTFKRNQTPERMSGAFQSKNEKHLMSIALNIEKARFNMVEQQIRPWDVLDQRILDLLNVVKREEFAPDTLRNLAFTDTEIALTPAGERLGEVMLAPKMDARILQELQVKKTDSVLEVGTGSGYLAAMLAKLAASVTTIEINPNLVKLARSNLAKTHFNSVEVIHADASEWQSEQLFDVIVFSGSVGIVEDQWLRRLTPGGRLAAYVGSSPVMQAKIYERSLVGATVQRVIFETDVPRLHGFAEPSKFVF
jgi:protein-L-isoaspartate(D-aspartate) O-methyltransferase